MDLSTAILVGIVFGGGIYFILEIREFWKFEREGPSKPVAGLESAIGQAAIVSENFVDPGSGHLMGRVEFEGENWRAEYIGNQATVPVVGQSVEVLDVDTGSLTVKVE